MAKQTVTIKNFKGINLHETRWQEGFAKYAVGVDMFGLGDNSSKASFPGVLQSMRTMAAGTEAAATNDVTDLVRHFSLFGTEVWGMSGEASPRLYKRDSGTWTLQRSTSGGDLATASGGAGLATFAGSLWAFQNTRVSRWTGAAWTASFGVFANGTSTPRPSKEFGGTLFIGNDNVIASIDSTPTFTSTSLTLPSDFTVKSMEVYLDRLYMSADNGQSTRIFVWNGTDASFERQIEILDEDTAPKLVLNEGILWAIAVRGTSTKLTPIYAYNGSVFEKIFHLPLGIGAYSDVSVYRGGLLITSSNWPTAKYEDGSAGLWMINRHTSSEPYSATIAFNPGAGGVSNTRLSGIYSAGQTVYVAVEFDPNNTVGTTFEIWEIEGTDTNTAGIWQSLPIDVNAPARNKTWDSIRIDSELDNESGATPTVVVKYRLDHDSSFTTARTITPSDGPESWRRIPIRRRGKTIEVRLELTSTAGTLSTRIHGISLDYSISSGK